MKNDNQLQIVYKYYIPENWIEEFKDNAKTESVSVQSIKDNQEFDNFDGPELSDIIIYISSALVSPAIYDIVKYGVVRIYKKLGKLDNETTEKKLSIRYEDTQGKFNINLEGNISDDLIENVVEESLDFIKSNKKEKLYTQEDFVSNAEDNPTVELQYNQESKRCEPVNFGEIRRFWKKMEDEIDNLD